MARSHVSPSLPAPSLVPLGSAGARWLLIALCLVLVGCAQRGNAILPISDTAGPFKSPGPLRVLLTNDDGYASPGIRAVRDALERDGHSVTICAPSENRSGAGSSITSHGSLALVEHEPGIYSVSGTPADSVRVGLDVLFSGAPPDVVVSGANFGENIGPAVLVSGTVGAALTAVGEGIPAIAISVGINIQEARAEPVLFPSTLAAFPAAAAFTARLVRTLDASRRVGEPLLPPRTVVNVNHPARLAEKIAGVAYTNIGQSSHFRFGYERAAGDTVAMTFEPDDSPEPVANADTTRFSEGFITISVLDGDVLAPRAARAGVEGRMRELLEPVAAAGAAR